MILGDKILCGDQTRLGLSALSLELGSIMEILFIEIVFINPDEDADWGEWESF